MAKMKGIITKTNGIFASIILSFALILPVFAQESAPPPSTTAAPAPKEIKRGILQERQDLRQNIREQKQDVRQNIKEERQDVRQNIKEERQAVKAEVKQFRQEEVKKFQEERLKVKEAIEVKRAEFKEKIQVKREEVKGKIEAKRAELKQNLAKIKDERKKAVAERIYQELNKLNERTMNHFVDVLNHLEKTLEKIKDRTAKAETNGRDVAAVRTAISDAEQAISASRSAVEIQSKKTYDFTFDSEETLKLNIGKARQALHSDISGVRKTVFDAREAVRRAATTLAQIPKVDELEVATTTPAATTPTQ